MVMGVARQEEIRNLQDRFYKSRGYFQESLQAAAAGGTAEPSEIAAINELQKLERYRALTPQQWRDPNLSDQEFVRLRSKELHNREVVRNLFLRWKWYDRAANIDWLTGCEEHLIPRVKELADELVRAAQNRVPYSDNQIRDIRESGGQSMTIVERVRENPAQRLAEDQDKADSGILVGLDAACALKYGGGNCAEKSAYIASEGMRRYQQANIQLTIFNHEGADHVAVVVGDPATRWAHISDAWVKGCQESVPASEYGLTDWYRGKIEFSDRSDGTDYINLAREEYIQPVADQMPSVPKRVAPFSSNEETVAWLRRDPPKHDIFDITRSGPHAMTTQTGGMVISASAMNSPIELVPSTQAYSNYRQYAAGLSAGASSSSAMSYSSGNTRHPNPPQYLSSLGQPGQSRRGGR